MTKKIFIHGGSSMISKHLIEKLQDTTDQFYIFCRSTIATKEIINFNNYKSNKFSFYENDLSNLESTLKDINKLPNDITGVFWITGYTGFPEEEWNDINLLKQNLEINFLNVVVCLNLLTKKMILTKKNFLCVLTSVAGLRGRKQRLFYSAAESGLISFMSGLRQKYNNRLKIVTVVPGYMSTKSFNIKAPKFLVVSPKQCARIILNGINSNQEIIYINWLWKIIMFFVNLIPEKIFKKLSF